MCQHCFCDEHADLLQLHHGTSTVFCCPLVLSSVTFRKRYIIRTSPWKQILNFKFLTYSDIMSCDMWIHIMVMSSMSPGEGGGAMIFPPFFCCQILFYILPEQCKKSIIYIAVFRKNIALPNSSIIGHLSWYDGGPFFLRATILCDSLFWFFNCCGPMYIFLGSV